MSHLCTTSVTVVSTYTQEQRLFDRFTLTTSQTQRHDTTHGHRHTHHVYTHAHTHTHTHTHTLLLEDFQTE